VANGNQFNEKDQKAVDVVSAYIQILIGLASGIIAAVLAFYSNISQVQHLNVIIFQASLICLFISAAAGLVSYMTLTNAIGPKRQTAAESYYYCCP
jgi:hypothetical protein